MSPPPIPAADFNSHFPLSTATALQLGWDSQRSARYAAVVTTANSRRSPFTSPLKDKLKSGLSATSTVPFTSTAMTGTPGATGTTDIVVLKVSSNALSCSSLMPVLCSGAARIRFAREPLPQSARRETTNTALTTPASARMPTTTTRSLLCSCAHRRSLFPSLGSFARNSLSDANVLRTKDTMRASSEGSDCCSMVLSASRRER
mmetsp:Transcript_28070/g.70098  ORF Transcript_28070/g.70098 Transcript_28070/m.70098 type:complete len:204 (-) Transcript_28070:214-825(-)